MFFCMTGWWGIYSSKNEDDMLWPDMIWLFILAYDVWNFEYTYSNLPTHSWYCGVALLLALTFAAAIWNKGDWIQNRANTLAIWCMFAQVIPEFQDSGEFAVLPVLYKNGAMNPVVHPGTTDPTMMGVIAILSLAINVVVFAIIWKRAMNKGINPYTHEIFVGTKDYEEAIARAQK